MASDFFPQLGEAAAGFLEELAVCLRSLQMSELLAWNGEVAFLSSHRPLLTWKGRTFSTLAWKRGVPNLDNTNVWTFFLKVYTATEFDWKNAVDFEDHWTGTIKEEYTNSSNKNIQLFFLSIGWYLSAFPPFSLLSQFNESAKNRFVHWCAKSKTNFLVI